jgi:hypothetical protein
MLYLADPKCGQKFKKRKKESKEKENTDEHLA